MGVIDNAVQWATDIANDDSHWYSQDVRWGPHYDCSSFVITAYQNAGVPVKDNGATYTGDMYNVFISCGFKDVTSSCNLSNGAGMLKGDVLLNKADHTALVQADGGTTVEARGTSFGIVTNVPYRNYPWDCVLRYTKDGGGYIANWVEREIPNIGKSLATKSYMAYQTYTNSQASGYKYLWGSDSSTSNGGLRKYKDFICMALGSYYGPDGTFVKIEFDDGKVIYAVKGDEKKDSETDSRHMYHTGSDANMTEFIIDGNVVIGNEKFTSALEAEGINRSARVVRIWTSDTEPTYGSTGSTSGEKEYHFADTNEKIPIHNSIFKQAPMLLDGALKVVVNDTDVSKHIGDISWTNTKNTLATTMSFSTPKPKEMKYMNIYIPQMGDIMRYSGGDKEDFRGVIIEVDDGAMYENKYTAVDVGWYLNKTTDTYQFTSMRADDCIKKICNDLYIPIVLIPELSTLITQIYIDKPVSDVIKDILDKCGNGYNFDFVPDGMRIYLCSDKVVEPKFRISPNTELKNSVQYMGNIEHKGSIENMKNSVKVITDTDVMTTLKAEESISKYGFLQEVVKMNDGDNASDLAKKNLGELNKEDETYSGEIIEELTSYTRAGSTIEKDGVKYVITSSQHSIKQGVHYNKLDLEMFKDRENATGDFVVFGKIIELPNLKIQFTSKIILTKDHIKSLIDLYKQDIDGRYVYKGREVAMIPYRGNNRYLVLGVTENG